MAKPLVSVSIITYNQEDYIRDCILSVVTQEYDRLEVVVADDGSTDGTVEIIRALAKQYPNRLIPLIDGPNLGITGNSNRALKACCGDYIAFMGGDDVLLPGKISKQVEWFEKDSKRALCYHDIEVFDSSDNRTLYQWSDRYRFHSGGAEKIIEYGTFFGATSVMVRVPKAKQVQFDSDIPLVSDWLYWIEVVTEQSGTIGSVDGIYARYRRHPGNITRQRLKMLNDRLKVLDVICDKYPQFKSLVLRKRPEVLFNEAARAFLNKNVILALKLLGKMVVSSKGHLGWPMRTLVRAALRLKY